MSLEPRVRELWREQLSCLAVQHPNIFSILANSRWGGSQDLASARTCYSKGWWFVVVLWVKGECKALKANLPPSSSSPVSPRAGHRNQNFSFSIWLRETKNTSLPNRAIRPRKNLTSALKTLTPHRSYSISRGREATQRGPKGSEQADSAGFSPV